MKLSERISQIKPSPTLAITQKAKEMKAKGIDVISFGAGEPDFSTPARIIDEAKAALDAGMTHYTPVPGIPELRKAICDHIYKKTDVKYLDSQVMATCGAKSAIFIALQVLLDPGDEVIVPAPYWVSYPDQVTLAGGIPKIVMTDEANQFKLKPEDLSAAITEKTSAIIINSPSNPTGSIYSKKELSALVEICINKNITIIADEIYDQLIYDGTFTSVLSSHHRAAEHTIYINGVSKGYAMTGWRMGYAAGPETAIKAMCKYQGQLLTCIPGFVQKAATTALLAPESMTADMLKTFKERRDLIIKLIHEIRGLQCVTPAGAFYAFVNVSNYFGRREGMTDSQSLAEYLLNDAHVAVVPGSAFGMDDYVRLSFATNNEAIIEGLRRMKEAFYLFNH